MSNETFIILPTELSDAYAVRACNDRAFGSDSFRDHIFPESRKHLTPPEELTEWRANSLRKMLTAGDIIHFKCVPEDDHAKILGYSAWYRPGHFAKKTLAESLLGKSDAETKSPPTSDLTAQTGAKPPQPGDEREEEKGKKEEDALPACMDVQAYKDLGATMDRERKKIWGDDVNFWYLGGLAVDPAYQRRGIARRLIDMGLEWADDDGVPAYLEATPEGAKVYPNFGFKKVGEHAFFDGALVSEFHVRQPGASTPVKAGFPKP